MLSKNVTNKICTPKFESQIFSLFDTSTLHQFAKFNDFLNPKNLTNFVSLPWKHHNRNCHRPWNWSFLTKATQLEQLLLVLHNTHHLGPEVHYFSSKLSVLHLWRLLVSNGHCQLCHWGIYTNRQWGRGHNLDLGYPGCIGEIRPELLLLLLLWHPVYSLKERNQIIIILVNDKESLW